MTIDHTCYILECRIEAQAGAAERLLRQIRVRGFKVLDLALGLTGEIYKAKLIIMGCRNIENLTWQLQKQAEVLQIKVSTVIPTKAISEKKPTSSFGRCA
jgi:acetolactate synthase regulatory subunit